MVIKQLKKEEGNVNMETKVNNMKVFAVYPDAERIGLGENKLTAIFRYRSHAEQFGEKMWGKYYVIKEIICDLF